jgi:hypothetical protein
VALKGEVEAVKEMEAASHLFTTESAPSIAEYSPETSAVCVPESASVSLLTQ